jgi:hypothetical protein
MVLIQALKDGVVAAVRTWRGTVMLFTVNVLLAGIAAFAFRSGFQAVFGSSSMSEAFMDGFDFPAYSALAASGAGMLAMMTSMALWMVVAHMLTFACVGGGVIAAIGEDDRMMSVGEILKSGGLFAGRFLRILLLELAMLAIVAVAAGLVYGWIVGRVYSVSVFEIGVIRALYATAPVILIPVGIVMAVAEYARVIMVARDERSSVKALGQAFRFVFRNLVSVLALELVLVLAGVLVLVLFWAVTEPIGMTGGGTIFAVLLLQEAFIFLRMGVKVWNYGTVMSFWEIRESQHEAVRPVPASAPVPAPAAPSTPVPVAPVRKRRALRSTVKRRTTPVRRTTSTRKKRSR